MFKFKIPFIAASVLIIAQPQIGSAKTIGLIGGDADQHSTYAAFVNPNGTLTEIVSAESLSFVTVESVAINNQGASLIGGEGATSGFAIYVMADGSMINLAGVAGFPSTTAKIYSVAINDGGFGIMGGEEEPSINGPAYASLVAPNGTLTPLSGTDFPSVSGIINSVAINNSGLGLIGGIDETSGGAYGAIVASNGTLTQFSGGGFPSVNGHILTTAINDSDVGIIGGINGTTGLAYAALVNPNGSLTEISGTGLPTNFAAIFGVGINQKGKAIIGGEELFFTNGPAYAAFVAPDGTITPLSGDGFPSAGGSINSVAINDAGAAIIGGQDFTGTQPAFAALVAPNGTLTRLSGAGFPSIEGFIYSVAINDAGVGLIGGKDLTGEQPAFAALVAPNGTLTQLTSGNFPSFNGEINSVTLILQNTGPQSIGSFWNAINTQLAAIYTLESHLINRNRACDANSLWIAPFGNYVHQKADGNNPANTDEAAGLLFGYDCAFADFLLGASFGYAFNYIHYASGIGHGNVQEEMLNFYGVYERKHLSINFVIWGGLYQLYNERHLLSLITSTSHTHGWLLSPQLEVAAPFGFVEPFVLFDWVNNWQHHFTEKGASGFNLIMGGRYGSVLRSEAGLRFFEEWCLSRGKFVFEQKLSYVNQAPFYPNSVNTAFIASASSFPIAIGSTKVQNLGGMELSASYLHQGDSRITLDFQGEFGASYQSYFLGLEFNKAF